MDWNKIQSLWGAARVGGRGQSVKLVANALVGSNPMLPTRIFSRPFVIIQREAIFLNTRGGCYENRFCT